MVGYVIATALLIAAVVVGVRLVRDRVRGKAGCGCGCSCSSAGASGCASVGGCPCTSENACGSGNASSYGRTGGRESAHVEDGVNRDANGRA